MFAAVENLEDNGDINRAWDNIKENVNHGLIRNLQNWLMEESRLNYTGCRTLVK
jgi:hypothetical protein